MHIAPHGPFYLEKKKDSQFGYSSFIFFSCSIAMRKDKEFFFVELCFVLFDFFIVDPTLTLHKIKMHIVALYVYEDDDFEFFPFFSF